MAKTNSKGIVMSVPLPEGFEQSLREAMHNELETAQKKWGVELDEEQTQRVLISSWQQLQGNTVEEMHQDWSPKEPDLKVFIQDDSYNNEVYVTFSRLLNDQPEMELVMSKGWKVATTPNRKNIPLATFKDYVTQWLLDSSRWAVFYGVGSYAD